MARQAKPGERRLAKARRSVARLALGVGLALAAASFASASEGAAGQQEGADSSPRPATRTVDGQPPTVRVGDAWLPTVAGILGLLLGAGALWYAGSLQSVVGGVQQELHTARAQLTSLQTHVQQLDGTVRSLAHWAQAQAPAAPTSPAAGSGVAHLEQRLTELAEQYEALREELVRRDRQHVSGSIPVGPPWDMLREGSAPSAGGSSTGPVAVPSVSSVSEVKVMPGVLTPDEMVKSTSSSRPMVEIRWKADAGDAEVWVKPDYKFADLTANYIAAAFDGGAGPGSYETISPAVIEWSAGASAGRVRQRGRVRPMGG